MPVDVLAYAGDVYIGTTRTNGRGALWGPRSPAQAGSAEGPGSLPVTSTEVVAAHVHETLQHLDEAIARVGDFRDYRVEIIPLLEPIAARLVAGAGAELSSRLTIVLPDIEIATFGHPVSLTRLHQWYLLWAIGLSGEGTVPAALIRTPWDLSPNRPDKYFHPGPAAAWTVARVGQSDLETLGTLIEGLATPGEPDWLDGDRVGALTALTGQRFGYERGAWRAWWAARRGDDMVVIPAGPLDMGSEHGEEAEAPVHRVHVSAFLLDRFEVTNEQFAEFVSAIGHVTDRERGGWGWHWTGRWHKVEGADWRHPQGAGSSSAGRDRHPVVQVSWNDARGYCEWRGKRLPTEAQWGARRPRRRCPHLCVG